MNYRQWKKKYKKKHGYNPPISEDRKERNRRLARTLPVFMDEFMPELFGSFAKSCELLSDSFANAAKSFKCAAENFSIKRGK